MSSKELHVWIPGICSPFINKRAGLLANLMDIYTIAVVSLLVTVGHIPQRQQYRMGYLPERGTFS